MTCVVPADARLEVKFVAPPASLDRLEAWLRVHPAAFSVAHPDRWVNSVYFDSHSLAAYGDNIAGVSCRTKVRYRWYGVSAYPGPGNLEVKYKRNSFGWKRHFPVSEPAWVAGRGWKECRERIGRQAGEEARLWLNARPNPVVLNRYYRQYHVSGDGVIRVTIDSRQRAFDQRYGQQANVDLELDIPRLLVVEFKCHRSGRDRLSEVIQGLPIRVGRHSKYAAGVGARVR